MTAPDPPSPAPHLESSSWGRLVDSLDIASIFVVLSNWLGVKLQRHVSVEDIWQETLWMAWRDREQHEWRGLSAYRVWLLSIARNRVRDASRSIGRQKRGGDRDTAPFSELAGTGSVSGLLPPGSTTPSRVAGHRERATAMQLALETLDPTLRSVVHLRLFEELSMREVATTLDIPLSTAKERLLRGVRKYRTNLRKRLGGDSIANASQP